MNRSATAGELSASIAHEIKQPLQAITANGDAGLHLLKATTPDLAEAREAFQDIVDQARRADGILGTIRSMFMRCDQEKVAVNINGVIEEVLTLLRTDFWRRRVLVKTRLGAGLALVRANRIQLQQVILNLCVNAADAMDSVTDRDRVLTVTTEQQPTCVVITVEDLGKGVEPKNIETYLNLSTLLSPMVWAWDCRFVGPLSRSTGGACVRLAVGHADWQCRFHCRRTLTVGRWELRLLPPSSITDWV
jgi:C4-dicarboxylate-specific signal transduction histidine kinase